MVELERRLRDNDPTLTNLVLPNQRGCCRLIFEALAANTTVQTAHLEMTGCSDDDLTTLQDAGGLSNTVTDLYLSRNQITGTGLVALSTGLGRLRQLNLSCNALGSDLHALGSAVSQSPCLTTLGLNQTQQSGEGIPALVSGLCLGAHALTELQLQSCGIGDDVAGAIAPLVAQGRVESLLLTQNDIGDRGAAMLAESCATGAVLTRLSLMANSVGDAGVVAFAKAFETNCQLKRVNFSHNQGIGDESVALLVGGSLSHNTHLSDLDVSRCSVKPNMLARLRECLSKENVRDRRHRAFRPIANMLLRAIAASSSPLLSRLPHTVVLKICDHACPDRFSLQDEFGLLIQG